MNKTEQVLKDMLVERVETSIFDSGGRPTYVNGVYAGSHQGYGRSFEINRGIDFDKVPPTIVTFRKVNDELDITFTHTLYHWLKSRCEYDETIDNIFHDVFSKCYDTEEDIEKFPRWLSNKVTREGVVVLVQKTEPILPTKNISGSRKERKIAKAKYLTQMALYKKQMKEYLEWEEIHKDDEYHPVGGVYGEGKPIAYYTYNVDNCLSQDIRFLYFTWGVKGSRDEYIILQIHGGADARIGFTDAKVFRLNHDSECSILDVGKGSIGCTGRDHHPTALKIKEFQETQVDLPGIYSSKIDFTDCRKYWDTDDGCNFSTGNCGEEHLENMEFVELEDDDDWKPGILCIKDGIGYCPQCGAKLGGMFW